MGADGRGADEAVSHQVVVAGGGPTGMMLGIELTLAGVDVLVVERRASKELDGSRAGGLHARTIEVLDQRGVVERFLAEGTEVQAATFAGTVLDVSDLPTRHPFTLALWQKDFERILGGWAEELGVPVRRDADVVGFDQDDDGVTVELADGGTLRAEYLVGCDGGRSIVRKAAGIDFPGWDATTSWLIAETRFAEAPQLGLHPAGGGIGPVHPTDPNGTFRAVIVRPVDDPPEATIDHLRAALQEAYGSDFGVHDPTWISRFSDVTRQADRYRSGRVLLAGDAAHVHPPQGGQGLNTGVQDAVNLGWKLARVVQGHAPDALLDTYHDERHPVGARALRNTMAHVAIGQTDDRHQALRDTVAELLALDAPRQQLAASFVGLDVHYDLGTSVDDHPLVGRRMPDLDLVGPNGPTRVYEHLHDARPLLLDLRGDDASTIAFPGVRTLVATTDAAPWALPAVGDVEPPAAVLVRPDGHVAWVGDLTDPTDPTLADVVTRWFGSSDPVR